MDSNPVERYFSTYAPILRCLPDRVKGTPILREIFALRDDNPMKRRQEKPPLFIEHPEEISLQIVFYTDYTLLFLKHQHV